MRKTLIQLLILAMTIAGFHASAEPEWSRSTEAGTLIRESDGRMKELIQRAKERNEEMRDLAKLAEALDKLTPKPFAVVGVSTPKLWQVVSSLDAPVSTIEDQCRVQGPNARLSGQRLVVRRGANAVAIQLCSPSGEIVVRGKMYVLLVAHGNGSTASGSAEESAKAALPRLCTAQGGAEAGITGEVTIVGEGTNVYAAGVCRYWVSTRQ